MKIAEFDDVAEARCASNERAATCSAALKRLRRTSLTSADGHVLKSLGRFGVWGVLHSSSGMRLGIGCALRARLSFVSDAYKDPTVLKSRPATGSVTASRRKSTVVAESPRTGPTGRTERFEKVRSSNASTVVISMLRRGVRRLARRGRSSSIRQLPG